MKMKFRNIDSLLDKIQDNVPESTDDVLEALGLQRRRSVATVILPAVGTLVVGAAIGAVLGMLFGPRYGNQLMDRMGVKLPSSLREATGINEGRGIGASGGNNNATMRTRSDVHS